MKEKCSHCGVENEPTLLNEIQELGKDGIFYLEKTGYECWYCGEKWVNIVLKSRKKDNEQ